MNGTARAMVCVAALSLVNPCVARPILPAAPLERWKDKLELTDEQVRALEGIHYESRVDEIARRAALERAELELEREMNKDLPDQSTALRLFDDVHKARGELEKAHLRATIRIRGVLTPHQRQRLEELMRTERPPRPPRPPRGPERPKEPAPR